MLKAISRGKLGKPKHQQSHADNVILSSPYTNHFFCCSSSLFHKFLLSFRCRFCPPDDDTTAKFVTDDLDICAELTASGSANFANVKGCSFTYLEADADESKNARVVIKGALRNLSTEDAKIFEESITAAYNDAYLGMSSVEFKTVTDAPLSKLGGCRFCPPDDDTTEAGHVIIASTNKSIEGCRFCPPDDDAMHKDAKFHTAFEKSLCTKLASSGSANFANVHGCSVSYVHGNDEGVVASQA